MPGPGPGSLNQMICTHTQDHQQAFQELHPKNSNCKLHQVTKQHGNFATWKMHLKLLPDNSHNSQARQRGFSDCNMLTAKNLTTLTRHCGKSMICTWTLQTSTVVGSCLTVAISNSRPLHTSWPFSCLP